MGLQYVGISGLLSGHRQDGLVSFWLENRPLVVKGLNNKEYSVGSMYFVACLAWQWTKEQGILVLSFCIL